MLIFLCIVPQFRDGKKNYFVFWKYFTKLINTFNLFTGIYFWKNADWRIKKNIDRLYHKNSISTSRKKK